MTGGGIPGSVDTQGLGAGGSALKRTNSIVPSPAGPARSIRRWHGPAYNLASSRGRPGRSRGGWGVWILVFRMSPVRPGLGARLFITTAA